MAAYGMQRTLRSSEDDEAGHWLVFGAAAMLLVAGGCGCGYHATRHNIVVSSSTPNYRVCDGEIGRAHV